ncbi:hypothetical protein [uncultured Selenomonas sp.]|uniref:hypothetical protein n=1 Tax=uncultured Selenomonas sp. TaxID=159275 RepID=UPI0025FB90B1|nr:hypothetical protein [uncultured Selenomonas sp.]
MTESTRIGATNELLLSCFLRSFEKRFLTLHDLLCRKAFVERLVAAVPADRMTIDIAMGLVTQIDDDNILFVCWNLLQKRLELVFRKHAAARVIQLFEAFARRIDIAMNTLEIALVRAEILRHRRDICGTVEFQNLHALVRLRRNRHAASQHERRNQDADARLDGWVLEHFSCFLSS